ncbi:Rho GTPase activation protein [Chaetomium fimeti]|uniref:Rho GTPase activation protein n=1 Tax=Chaetomium fimeti TaxID=1854472 RepID=A0AAE0HNI3_9PEZI|nr:Rho GTPase activation protein [Chaetomium fimeti]
MGILDRLRWLSKEQEIKDVLQRLESHKSSLSLMMTILSCQKQDDAEDKVDRLCDLVQQALGRYDFLNQRLTTLELQGHGINPSPTTRYHPTLPPLCATRDNGDQISGTKRPGPTAEIRVFAFEELLMTSRAYRNASGDGSDCFSIMSSAGRTASWSMLSGLSLSEISQIAILAIPIYAGDISNNESYEFEPPAVEPTSNVDTVPPSRPPPQEAKKSTPRRLLGKLTGSYLQRSRPRVELPLMIFGAPLYDGLNHANVAISLSETDDCGPIYGYIPIVVGKTGVFLKESGTDAVDIFTRNGNPTRIMHLQSVFDSYPYGKGHSWIGYTVYDAAGLLLRFLKSLPESVIPRANYERFRTTLGSFANPNSALDEAQEKECASRAQELCVALPAVNRALLFYILDLMDVFSYHSDVNGVTAERLAATFQPSLLSGPPNVMDGEAHNAAIEVIALLIRLASRDLLQYT